MNADKELDLLLNLIRKYNLPLSPILEYAINEKKEELQQCSDEGDSVDKYTDCDISSSVLDEQERSNTTEDTVAEEAPAPTDLKGGRRRRIVSETEHRSDQPWTENEDELLKLYSQLDYSLDKMASSIGRSVLSVKRHLIELGLWVAADYRNEDNTPVAESVKEIDYSDFFVDNTRNRGFVFDKRNQMVYSVDGQLKMFNGRIYRFKYQNECFTVKPLTTTNGVDWSKGDKLLVAYNNSPLHGMLNAENYVEQIEDFVEGESRWKGKILLDGRWYNNRGYPINDTDNDLCQSSNDTPKAVAIGVNTIEAIPADEWFNIASWGDETHRLTVEQSRTATYYGNMRKSKLSFSDKHQKEAFELWNVACRLGYMPEEGSPAASAAAEAVSSVKEKLCNEPDDVSFHKYIDGSLLTAGLILPLNVIGALPALEKGEKRTIQIHIGNESFEAKYVNVEFSEKYAGHGDVFQIRYSVAAPIALKLQKIFVYSYNEISRAKRLGKRLPKGATGEYIKVHYSKESDTWAFYCFPKFS